MSTMRVGALSKERLEEAFGLRRFVGEAGLAVLSHEALL